MISLTINGLPICGAVNTEITISTQECWEKWWRYIEKKNKAPFCPLREYAEWRINDQLIPEPESWFITLGETHETTHY